MVSKVYTDPASRARADRFHAAAEASAPAPVTARVPDEVRFGAVRIAPATILAPMAGVTDTVFRRFIKHASFGPGTAEPSGCGLIMTEFTSADGIYRTRESKRKRYLHFYEDEHPISAQLFGSDPHILAEAAKIVEQCGFDLVDLNLGCPAKKVVKCNGGSGLLRDLPHIKVIFETVRAAVKIPFTVKFRMGWDDTQIVCVELARLAESCGLQAVALHARTREQGYSGEARWEWIAAVKDAVKLPVIGNGDIRTPEDAALMVAKTGCDAVMIGRTAPSNPWIFRQIAQYNARVGSGERPLYEQPTAEDRHQMMRTYFRMLIEEDDGIIGNATGKMKQFATWFTHGIPGGKELRKVVYDARSEQQVMDAVERFFAEREANASEESVATPSSLEQMPMADCG
ncbi:MAG: tRNA dihydrouridine synthase DusB [Acidobacteriales bacterium]|nr:tRNA dihydrouridine synthase DusB [Terriglobales bacterium]